MKRLTIALVAAAVAGCSGWENAQPEYRSSHSAPVKLAPYLYEMEYSAYNPGAVTLIGTMVVRYVLDNCASAREACDKLSRMNIKASATLGEFHYMIADPERTYVVETIDNRLVFSDEGGSILTNYYLLYDGLTPHAVGMEREALLREHYAEGTTVEGMSALMQRVRYSKIYDRSVSPFWYSDFVGDVWKGREITIDTPHEFYDEMIDRQIETFRNRRRNYLDANWITTHTTICDFRARTLRVYSQEDYSKYWEFGL